IYFFLFQVKIFRHSRSYGLKFWCRKREKERVKKPKSYLFWEYVVEHVFSEIVNVEVKCLTLRI
ncbi:MAG: hypothetical protein ACK5HT_06570, partial [Draconibacterium sp.]